MILRFFRQDQPRMAAAADALFARAQRGEVRLILDSLILAEVLFVLQSFYKLERGAISAALLDLVNSGGAVETDRPALLTDALERYRRVSGLDFADAILAALAAEHRLPVASFERDFDQFVDITRVEPPAADSFA